MSYEKQTWVNGEVITDTKLNHMEDGIENSGGLVVTYSEEGTQGILDKTWNEIMDAMPNVYVHDITDAPSSEDYYIINNVYSTDSTYGVRFGDSYNLSTSTPDGYPTQSFD